MSSSPVINPDVPYVGEVPGGLFPGKMVKIHGSTSPDAVRFAVNYQLGSNLNPRDDIAIHLSPRFSDGFITRNHISSMAWGPEENQGPMAINPGQEFQIIILCEPLQYKIAINGRHFTEFGHRLPYQKVTHLVIDGDVEIKSITFESLNGPPANSSGPQVPQVDYGPPAPGGIYPSLNPQAPPSDQTSYYDLPKGHQQAYIYRPEKPEEEEEGAFGGCLDKVGLAIGAAVAAGGVAAAVHAYNKKKHEHDNEPEHEKSDSSKTESEGGLGNLGALGAALASSLASNAIQNSLSHGGGGGGGGGGGHQGYPQDSSGGMFGSILGALGGGGSHHAPQQPAADPLSGALGSILGGVLGGGGGGHQQPYGGGGGYQPSGGYASQQPQQHSGGGGGGGGGDFLSNIMGSAIGSTLINSALDNLTKPHSYGDRHPSSPQPNYYAPTRNDPPSPHPTPRASTPPQSSGGKLTAAEISKGLGLSDDEE